MFNILFSMDRVAFNDTFIIFLFFFATIFLWGNVCERYYLHAIRLDANGMLVSFEQFGKAFLYVFMY